MILFDLFPNGKKKVVTFSYDDGSRNDIRLIETLDKYGAKATLNLVSNWTCAEKTLHKDEIIEISKTHEIANHTKDHVWNERVPLDQMVSQVIDAKNFFIVCVFLLSGKVLQFLSINPNSAGGFV